MIQMTCNPFGKGMANCMMKSSILSFLSLSLCFQVFAYKHVDGGKKRPQLSLQKVTGRPASTLLNINNLAMWARDDGLMERRPQDLNAGVTFPRGTSTIVYAGGLIWGGLVQDGSSPVLRV